jgi:hypothetical protein
MKGLPFAVTESPPRQPAKMFLTIFAAYAITAVYAGLLMFAYASLIFACGRCARRALSNN